MASSGDVDWAGAADAQEKHLVNRVGELNVADGRHGTTSLHLTKLKSKHCKKDLIQNTKLKHTLKQKSIIVLKHQESTYLQF